jgi:predicted flavoprotein YhiN
LKEVDPKNMKSKIIDNLYFAGEVLDINGPTGGYNLQVCWTTGAILDNK